MINANTRYVTRIMSHGSVLTVVLSTPSITCIKCIPHVNFPSIYAFSAHGRSIHQRRVTATYRQGCVVVLFRDANNNTEFRCPCCSYQSISPSLIRSHVQMMCLGDPNHLEELNRLSRRQKKLIPEKNLRCSTNEAGIPSPLPMPMMLEATSSSAISEDEGVLLHSYVSNVSQKGQMTRMGALPLEESIPTTVSFSEKTDDSTFFMDSEEPYVRFEEREDDVC
jgi:hypothetical protein